MPHLLADFAIIRYAIPLPETRNLTSNPTLLFWDRNQAAMFLELR